MEALFIIKKVTFHVSFAQLLQLSYLQFSYTTELLTVVSTFFQLQI